MRRDAQASITLKCNTLSRDNQSKQPSLLVRTDGSRLILSGAIKRSICHANLASRPCCLGRWLLP